ncbi:long-chain fatty acid--CoA ligase [Sporosarcina thermotolerans]|uniref:Long-chain fatty acid--CoA ligase n=1 Tax=Sporosarcina thermotolerans TaxID=633404 RepID=A0AAW9A7I6_9BACL|nr:long-chain fatty acid--CoA ligase [Sporosarcina thermotolerans]MDW0116969.1 long-chain fatty acid--CoA ligase [Sporosarcina thermotolerans]WHT47919.1 long-chain fatty acid--CoA ligase [Sporosarcina thermotolerans]
MFHEQGWILKRAALSPDRIALIDIHTDVRWSYKDLRNRIIRWASFFRERGFAKGERIAVYSPNKPELFAILFACEQVGLMYVPLNWRMSRPELQALLEDCTPVLVVYDDSFKESIFGLKVADSVSLTVIESLGMPENSAFEEKVNHTDPWMIIYTGGTTGMPKGVMLSYDAVNWNALNTIISWGLSEDDTTVNYMPLFHTGGLNALSIPLLMAGGTVAIGHQFDPEEALKVTDKYEATISLFVPTMYQMMIQTECFRQSSFPSMKVFLSGGAPCPATVYRSFRKKGLRFKEGYGLTEAGPNNFFIRPEDSERKVGSVGKSMLFNEIQVLDEEGNRCEKGEIGELLVKGPHVFSGYWNKPRETSEVVQDGWLRTGDLAKIDEDGDTFIVGRKKDMIITGGENVYPQEVEQCLINYSGIREAAVVGMADDKWGEIVVAFVVAVESDLYHDAVIAHCKATLASYKIPKKIVILDELPKTHVGKIDSGYLCKMLI